MSKILINKSGKGGPACSYSVDPIVGCNNGCIGCYGYSTSRLGQDKYRNNIRKKEYDDKEFNKSISSLRKKGIGFYRIGKHCDPYSPICTGETSRILEATSKAGIRSISISKSISRSRVLVDYFKNKNQILHISAGLLCNIKNEDRISTFMWYKRNGANVKLRITDDVTSPMSDIYKSFNNNDVIITSLRFKSRNEAHLYNVDLDNYEYTKGFWRPKFLHNSWTIYSNFCGEVGGRTLCCSCLATGEKDNV
jgi:hypothetical protein